MAHPQASVHRLYKRLPRSNVGGAIPHWKQACSKKILLPLAQWSNARALSLLLSLSLQAVISRLWLLVCGFHRWAGSSKIRAPRRSCCHRFWAHPRRRRIRGSSSRILPTSQKIGWQTRFASGRWRNSGRNGQKWKMVRDWTLESWTWRCLCSESPSIGTPLGRNCGSSPTDGLGGGLACQHLRRKPLGLRGGAGGRRCD